ncbi:hypothetical protein AVEN_136114-1 [Araneus ventricosus]|uniref:CCHC-type domain-containing protein n=1 Tax=Araneus ventricosus TaxID=182803 RepID=A0A4Y2TU48_ARAVE|nr:hypothetical protein AVEN_136114-1 [Araneus ventricosus]
MGSRNLAPDGEMRPSTSPEKEYLMSARYYVITRKEDSFKCVSPILIHKTIVSMVGDVKSTKKCKNGTLLIEVATPLQASSLMKLQKIGNFDVTVSSHSSLNQSKGVISESELQNELESDILDELRNQNVTAVKRISIRKDGQLIPTKHLILTFNLSSISKSVHIAYFNLSVRPYIPNPLRCYKCQRFGHTVQSCRGVDTCARCSLRGHDSKTCSSTPTCVNCKGDHPAYAKVCPRWKEEKEIQSLKTTQNLSFAEARKIIFDRTPKVGVSYSAATKKVMLSKYTQYEPETTEIVNVQAVSEAIQTKSVSDSNNNPGKTETQSGPSANNKPQKLVNKDNTSKI